jgi:hypothetical protein
LTDSAADHGRDTPAARTRACIADYAGMHPERRQLKASL